MSSQTELKVIASLLHQGKIIAYPTESCFGLGCDPDNQAAVAAIARLKGRSLEQGFILIGDSISQIQPYCETLSKEEYDTIQGSWPGPTTWLIPSNTHSWLTGKHPTLAVRVPGHDLAREICSVFGKPIISTSANPHGQPSAKSAREVDTYFQNQVDLIIDGHIGHQENPSAIIDLKSGQKIR